MLMALLNSSSIATSRATTSRGNKRSEYDDLRATLDQLVADKAMLEKKLHAAQSLQSACKTWLDRLPEGTALEPVDVKIDGHALEEVRSRIDVLETELRTLRAVPTPSADIEERVKAYAREMARPTISGIGEGEQLRVIWPGSGWDSKGPREHRTDVLPMMALLHGDAMVDALMREVECMTNDPVPIKERASRIAALTDEIEQLQRVEEALVVATGQREHDRPAEVILGVRVVATRSGRFAA